LGSIQQPDKCNLIHFTRISFKRRAGWYSEITKQNSGHLNNIHEMEIHEHSLGHLTSIPKMEISEHLLKHLTSM